MRMATYVGDGDMVITGANEKSRTLTKGVRVDLDEVLVSAKDKHPASTFGGSVAADIHLFKIYEYVRRAEKARMANELPKSEADQV